MSDNKQNEVLTGYEQLKRRNRRRLVMASGLVAASTVLLGVALSTGPENKQEENAQTTTIQQNNANAEPANLADATVLEPSTKEDLEAAAEAAKNADAEVAEAADKPQEIGTPERNAQAQPKPQPEAPPAAPEDLGPPLVLINDTLSDSDIKGLEESEKIQKAEAAKREAAERRAEERRRNREEQRKAQQPGNDGVQDGFRIFRAGIVRGGENPVAQAGSRLSHERPFALVPVAAAAENADDSSGLADETQRATQIGRAHV